MQKRFRKVFPKALQFLADSQKTPPTREKKMMRSLTSRFFSGIAIFLLISCGGSGLDGTYEGKIGSKNQVTLQCLDNGEFELRGYWKETLRGSFQDATLKGKPVDSLVFLGPEEKPFKLRICYDAQEGHLQILGIHSRIFGPGARYIPTEPDSTFANAQPKLFKLE